MSVFEPSALERAAIAALRECLGATAYPVLHALASGGQPLVTNLAQALAVAGPEPEWSWYRLIGLGCPIGLGELDLQERAVAELLLEAGLVIEDDGLVSTNEWIVVPALRGHLVTGLPPTHGGKPGAPAYLGRDSLRLAAALPDATGLRVLDVGTGCGVQGLLACRGASEVTLSDVDGFSLRVAGLNAVLNDLPRPVRLLEGSLYEPIAGERFGLVASVPAYVPAIEGSGLTVTAAGGSDGLAMLLPLLDGAAEILSDGGELWAIAQLLCDDDGPLLRDRVDAAARSLGVELYCSERHPFRPWISEIAGGLAKHGGTLSTAELVAQYSAQLRPLGVTGVCTALIRARAGSRVGLRVIGPAGTIVVGSVLRHVGRLVAEPAQVEQVGVEGEQTAKLDPLAMALLRAMDGTRDIAAAAAAGWGVHADADARDIEETAAWRAEELQRLGLVEVVPGSEAVVFAPFDDDEIDALDRRQSIELEPDLCPSDEGVLIPESNGWRCVICGARRTWARARDLESDLDLQA